MGNKGFHMQDTFGMIILMSHDDKRLNELIKVVPNIKDFEKFIIE